MDISVPPQFVTTVPVRDKSRLSGISTLCAQEIGFWDGSVSPTYHFKNIYKFHERERAYETHTAELVSS